MARDRNKGGDRVSPVARVVGNLERSLYHWKIAESYSSGSTSAIRLDGSLFVEL